jgi:hypothetical protein
VMHVNNRWRWRGIPVPAPLLAGDPLLYVARGRHDPTALLRAHFDDVTLLARIPRVYAGAIVEEYSVYRVARPTRPLLPWTSATGDGRAARALVSSR